ncbi:hypothetical protein EVC03_024 [Rhizobium phage RHph_Y5A]|nr:hypothetical protein EVC03_024 [Rhizobium phage RHph_Y5A]QIG75466.1 hypothetical protein EVC18_024 [Rhizobium phage RHph_Y2_4]
MTAEELNAALTEAARVQCGGFNNDYHKRMEVKRVVQLLETVTPMQYARMWQALLPDRDKPNWTECSLWETVTGSKTIGM